MLSSHQIRRLFATMIMFKGKISYSPATLNNQFHTYYLASEWQRRNADIALDPQGTIYSYENWIKLVKDVHKFNVDFCQPNDDGEGGLSETSTYALGLFNDW